MEPRTVEPRPPVMVRPMHVVRVVVAVLALGLLSGLLTACNDAEPSRAGTPGPSEAPTAEVSSTPRLTCGRGIMSWPAEAMDGRIESETPIIEVRAALVDLVERAGIDAPPALQDADIDDAPWFVLAEEPNKIAVATGPWTVRGPGKDAQVVYLEQENGGWRASGWGDCRGLESVLDPGQQWVRVYGVTGAKGLSRILTAMIGERACSSGRDPRPFLLDPSIVETDTTVVVTWTSKASGGGTCQGVPPVPQPLTLPSPLGDRVLLDGSTWPRVRVPVRE